MQRKAWHITEQGDMGSLQLLEEQLPALQPGHVLVEVQAWGLNFADVFCALGLYKAAPKGDFVPGGWQGAAAATVTSTCLQVLTSWCTSASTLQQQTESQHMLGLLAIPVQGLSSICAPTPC
jgi:hypothetical protein